MYHMTEYNNMRHLYALMTNISYMYKIYNTHVIHFIWLSNIPYCLYYRYDNVIESIASNLQISPYVRHKIVMHIYNTYYNNS